MAAKIKFAIPFAVILVLLGIFALELTSTRTHADTYSIGIVGDKAPALRVPNLEGSDDITNQSFAGKVVILNFFASWCSACRAEHPMLMKIKNQYHVPIIGVAFHDNPNDARAFLSQAGNPYTMAGYDSFGATAVDFGIYATPETFVISPAGDIVYKQIGVISQKTWDDEIYPIIKQYQS